MVNFLNFEPVFVLVSLVMGFVFPLLIYAENPNTAYAFSWNIPFSLDYFNKGAALWALGIVSFMAGTTSRIRPRIRNTIKYPIVKTNNIFLFLWMLLLLVYILAGGFTRYQIIYQDGDYSSPLFSYLEVFIVSMTEVVLANELWNRLNNKNYKFRKVSVLLIILVALLYLFVGNRTISLYLLLPIVFFISENYLKVKLIPFILAVGLGASLMIFMMFYRTGGDFTHGLDWYYYLADLMNPNTTTYLSCEIVSKEGFTYGVSQLGPILGAIPFAQSIISIVTGLDPVVTNSSHLFTKFLQAPAGTGTNYISDFYLAFGTLGVFVGSFYFAKILSVVRINSYKSYHYYLMYIIILGFAVYGVRSSLLYVIRFIIYGLFFAYINIKLQKK